MDWIRKVNPVSGSEPLMNFDWWKFE